MISMNAPYRRAVLALSVLLGLYVGVWAELFPHAFYTSFPGFGRHWISLDGLENQHLIRDVGSMYLALTAISIAAIASRTATVGRVAGLGWTVFGVLHLAYHLTHMVGSSTDMDGTVIGLGTSAILGVVLLLPTRTPTGVAEVHQ